MKKLTIALVAVAVSVTGAFAGTTAKTFKETVAPAPECKFRDQELQVDAFAAGAFYNSGRPFWGGGLGVNYFFTKYDLIERVIFLQIVFLNDKGKSNNFHCWYYCNYY
jgi:hypothetical protein